MNIPWVDSAHIQDSLGSLTARGERRQVDICPYINKIKPLMIGPWFLSIGMDRNSLMDGYTRYLVARKEIKQKKVMCYFGNSFGFKPSDIERSDYLKEGDVLGYFKGLISHPNEKRVKVADYIVEDKNNDTHVISKAYTDSVKEKKKSL